jgi:acetyl-CoA carboxylase biotin carboxyl carrier protein
MTGDLPLSPEDVAEIAAILDGSPYGALDIQTSRFRLKMRRTDKDGAATDPAGWTEEWDWQGAAERAPVAFAPVAEDIPGAIRAPLPGTFYHAPSPGAPPFVAIGDAVSPDTVIGIIETMKLFNPVHAGSEGTVAEIMADNGAMVAKGQALMKVG